LAQSELPAAAVVLSVPNRQLLGLGQHAGADPTRLALRPGSSVKPLLAWLGAEAGVLRPDDKVTCTGTYSASPEYRCYAVHGELTLPAALEVSCNVYFFELAHRVGLARITAGLARFGLGKPSGLSAGEASGWVADPAWAASRTKDGMQWELLVGTGHGPLGVTLLQLAVAYAELAERLTRPSRDVSDQMRAEILAGLRRVVAGERGTGRAAAVAGLEIAGKTGTAEPGVYADGQTARSDQKENGWFVGFTPVAAPERVVAVLVLGGQGGGQSAAPIAGRIFARMAKP
jgi:penicillin-binding protein 2